MSYTRTVHMHYCWVVYTVLKISQLKNLFFPFSCNKHSNCLLGNSRKIKNCTIFSPPVCDGCEDGYYLDPQVKPNGGCVECSPRCNILQVEIESCTTEHDRKCKEKDLIALPSFGKSISLQ